MVSWTPWIHCIVNDIFGMMYHVVFKPVGNVNQRLQLHFLWWWWWCWYHDIHRFWAGGHFVLPDTNIFLSQVSWLKTTTMLFLILISCPLDSDGPCGNAIIHTPHNFTANHHRRIRHRSLLLNPLYSRLQVSKALARNRYTSLIDTHLIKCYLSFPTNRLCNACFKVPSSHQITRQAPSLIGQKILVTIDRGSVTSRFPEGYFVQGGWTREFVVGVWGPV